MKIQQIVRIAFFYALSLLPTLMVIFFCEAYFRTYQPQQVYSKLLAQIGSYYAPSSFNRFTLKANFAGKMPSMVNSGDVTFRTNSLGLRNKPVKVKKPAGVKRILVLGDSYTFGVYVNDYETYPAALEQLFTENGYKVEVINAGYADGYEADEQYAWLVNTGLDFKPDLIIYGFFIGNDVNFDPKNWRQVDRKGLPLKIKDPNLSVDSFGRLRSRVADNKTVGAQYVYRLPLLRESHFFVALGLKLEALLQKTVRREEPAPGGYSLAWYPQIFGNDIAKRLNKKAAFDFEARKGDFEKILFGMSETAAAHGAKFIVLMIPFNFQVDPQFLKIVFQAPGEQELIKQGKISIARDYYKELEPVLAGKKINYINLRELMADAKGVYYPGNGEVHFSPAGCRFTAKKLYEFIEEHGLIEK